MKKLFLVGLVIKLFFIIFTFHHDLIFTWERPVNFFGNLPTIQTYYPPLTYIIFGLLSPIFYMSKYLGFWILKLPYLILDCGILYILLKMLQRKLEKRVLFFWWFNPVNIFSTYAIGQADILMAFAVMLAIFSAKRNKFLSMIITSAAISFKTTAIALVVPFSLMMGKNLREKIKLLFLGLIFPITLGTLVYLLTGETTFRAYFPTGLVPWPSFALRPDSIFEYISLIIGILGYALLIITVVLQKGIKENKPEDVAFCAITFFLVAVPLYSVHRYLVLIPLLVLRLIRMRLFTLLAVLSISLILGYVYTWNLQWGLIKHIYPDVTSKQALREFLSPWINYENVALLLRIFTDITLLIVAFKTMKLRSLSAIKLKII